MKTFLNEILSKFISQEERNSEPVTTTTILTTSFYIILLAFFISPPPIERLTTNFELNNSFKALSEQINGTYNSYNYAVESHESKLSYRIVPGLIGKLSFSKDPKVQMLFLYFIQIIFGFFFIFTLLSGIYKLILNPI